MGRRNGRLASTLRNLELLRRALDAAERELGSLGDYIERGRPTAEQAATAQRSITQWQQTRDERQQALLAEVARLRQVWPAVISKWATTHQTIYTGVARHYRDRADKDRLGYRTQIFIAEQAVAHWAEVAKGQRDFVLDNDALMRHHRALVRHHWGF